LQTVFAITALFPLIIAASSFGISETKISPPSASELVTTFKTQFGQLKDTLLNKKIFFPVLFVFLLKATPSADSVFFYFSVNELGFKPDFLGKVQVLGSLAGLAGVFLYRWRLKDVPVRDLILWTTVSYFVAL